MDLNAFQFFNGLFSLLTVALSFIVGLVMIYKYFRYKEKLLLFIGFAWMGVYQPWWPSAFVFLLNVFNVVNGGIDPRLYLLIGNMFLPATFIAWFLATTEMLFQEKRWLIVGFYAALTIFMDILIAYFVVVDYTFLGQIDVVNADFEPIMMIYLLFLDISIASTGILMGRESLMSLEPKIKLKGKFLISASICYVAIGLLDVGLVDFLPPILFFTRSIMILSSILFYFGFFLPLPIEKLFLE